MVAKKIYALLVFFVLFLWALLINCSSQPPQTAAPDCPEQSPCPKALPAPHILPDTRPEHRELGFWLSQMDDPDKIILDTHEINALNQQALGLSEDSAGLGARFDPVTGILNRNVLLKRMQKGLQVHRQRASKGYRANAQGNEPNDAFFNAIEEIQRNSDPASNIHLVTRITELRCHPTRDVIYEYAGDVDFDLFLCSTLRPGEIVREISRHPQGWRLVRSPYSTGWIHESNLGPEITQEEATQYIHQDPFVVVTKDRAPLWSTPHRKNQMVAVYIGQRLPLVAEYPEGELIRVMVPTDEGLRPGYMDASDVHRGYMELTGRALLTHAFAQLDDAFGWAGAGGDRDCSRFLMDLFALFGLHLPRNSYFQSTAGSFLINIEEMSREQKQRTLDQVSNKGAALLFMPGHIMLFLGRYTHHHFIIHQFSGYRVPCSPDEDIKMSVNRVAVTTLDLGEGSRRGSFLERITKITVFGHP